MLLTLSLIISMSKAPATPSGFKPVTLKRIATQLGLSVTTVARSLKDGHKISAETVQRVRDAADALGYVRNLDGLRLRTGQSLTIAAVIGGDDAADDPLRSALVGGLHRSLSRTDYALRSLANAERAIQPILSAMRSNRADGFVLDRLVQDDDRVALLMDHDFPFVTLGAPEGGCRHPYLRIDEAAAAHSLTCTLLAEGRRRIVLVDDAPHWIDVQARARGHMCALQEAGIAALPPLVPTAIAQDVAQLARSGQADAFLCGSDAVLPAVLDGIRQAGLKAGDAGMALRTARSVPGLLPMPIHMAWYPGEQAGALLADLLLARLAGDLPEALQRDVQAEILPATD